MRCVYTNSYCGIKRINLFLIVASNSLEGDFSQVVLRKTCSRLGWLSEFLQDIQYKSGKQTHGNGRHNSDIAMENMGICRVGVCPFPIADSVPSGTMTAPAIHQAPQNFISSLRP